MKFQYSRYVILVRHGKLDELKPEPSKLMVELGFAQPVGHVLDENRPLSQQGRREISDVASTLATQLRIKRSDQPQIKVAAVVTSPYIHCIETAKAISEHLHHSGAAYTGCLFHSCDLKPEVFWSDVDGKVDKVRGLIIGLLHKAEVVDWHVPSAVIIVGNMPQVGWLADRLLRRPFSHRPAPLSRGDALCIELRPGLISDRNRIVWTLAADDKTAAAAIRAKIERKMQSAQALSTVITLGLSASLALASDTNKLDNLLSSQVSSKCENAMSVFGTMASSFQDILCKPYTPIVFYASLAALFTSLALYFVSFFAYDRLLMPERFWSERLRKRQPQWLVSRPPSSSAWVLFQNMQRIWFRLFTPATWLLILGLAGFAATVVGQANLAFALFFLFGTGVFGLWYYYNRPRLGSED